MNKNLNKIIAISVVVFLGLVVFSARPAMGDATTLNGFAQESYDGNSRWMSGDSTFNGNITAIELDGAGDSELGLGDDEAINTNSGIYEVQPGLDECSWDASGPDPKGWSTDPETGDDLLFIAQYNGYVWASNWDANGDNTPDTNMDQVNQYEPIPTPRENDQETDPVGDTWINLTIPHFKYTDYNANTDSTNGQGTYECFNSFAVFINDTSGGWNHLGNSQQDPNNQSVDGPIVPMMDGDPDPSTIDTGADFYNITGLNPDTQYTFMVRANFAAADGSDPGSWGWNGGVGSATTFATGGSSAGIQTDPSDVPEFPNVLIPVVATIGVFAAITIYRKKKYE